MNLYRINYVFISQAYTQTNELKTRLYKINNCVNFESTMSEIPSVTF